jgi:predicted O-methyltransferase YrrM
MVAFVREPAYADLMRRFDAQDGAITGTRQTALLYATIQHLRSPCSLEIGTFFAHSTRIMADAMVDAGIDAKVVSLDPFGGERVPGIIAGWPAAQQAVTDFRACSSMQYFLDLESAATPKGAGSPLGVVFVDGHHNFEYALFDIIRSADHLAPGGAIFVDNLEQDGPRMALVQFLRWNPAWRLYFNERLYTPDDINYATFQHPEHEEVPWGVLLAPHGLQCGRQTFKIMNRGVPYVVTRSLALTLLSVSHPGTLNVNMSYYAIPFDFHVTGKGLSQVRAAGSVVLSPDDTRAEIAFPDALALQIAQPNSTTVCYEIELSFTSNLSDAAHVLLDAEQPVALRP